MKHFAQKYICIQPTEATHLHRCVACHGHIFPGDTERNDAHDACARIAAGFPDTKPRKRLATYRVDMLGPWHGTRVRITSATNQNRSTGIRLGAPITTAPGDYRELREDDYPEDGHGWFEGGYQNDRWLFNY